MTVWVVNASPLILLGKIGRLNVLKELCDQFVIPDSVTEEILAGPEDDIARNWVQSPEGQHHGITDASPPREILAWDLGKGETAVIAHALAHPNHIAILDDLAARTCAQIFGLRVLGTVGILLRAKNQGIIAAIRPELQNLLDAGSLLHPNLLAKALELADES